MSSDAVHVVVASDDLFAMPLTAAARSAVLRSAHPERVHVTVIDVGISSRNRSRITRSLELAGATVRVVPFTHAVPESALQGGVIPSVATFARLFTADYVPDADRAVYLDSDTISLSDVADLAESLAPDMLVAGVIDGQGDGRLENIERLRPLVAPGAEGPYINAGVLVMNLAAWRAEGITERFRELVATTPLRFADQDAINVVCAGRIQAIDPAWNTQTHLLGGTDRSLLSNPASAARIVHYTSRPKPWHLHGDVGLAEPWFEALDLTEWRGWRPTRSRLLVPKLRRGWRMIRTRPGQLLHKYLPGRRSAD
jgi:lipopolysaccharide biosynthesis glycosyltransferase